MQSRHSNRSQRASAKERYSHRAPRRLASSVPVDGSNTPCDTSIWYRSQSWVAPSPRTLVPPLVPPRICRLSCYVCVSRQLQRRPKRDEPITDRRVTPWSGNIGITPSNELPWYRSKVGTIHCYLVSSARLSKHHCSLQPSSVSSVQSTRNVTKVVQSLLLFLVQNSYCSGS